MRFVLACLLTISFLAAEATEGNWKVIKLLGSAPVAAMSDKQAAKLIGSTLQISDRGIHFAGESYPKPSFKSSRITRAEFYKGYKMTGNPLKLPSIITTEDLGCTTLVKVRLNRSIFYWDGYFYSAALHP